MHPDRVDAYYQQSGGSLPLNLAVPPDLIWKEVLEKLTTAAILKQLCDRLLADRNVAAVHPAVRAVLDAVDLLNVTFLAHDVCFLDRKRLRLELDKLSQPSPYGVLLVRGPSGSGKTHTRYLIDNIASERGARCVYLLPDLVPTVKDVVETLFTALDASDGTPPEFETEEAWFRKVCLKLQAAAQRTGDVCWVVVDDLGEYPEGPRFDRQIRRFFEQFGLTMANPAFAKWFRLVLLDYPDGPVPTKWRSYFWCEDRPNVDEVDAKILEEFLLNWAKEQNKQLGSEKAVQFAAEILEKATFPPSALQPPLPRLRLIHDELRVVLNNL